MHWWCSKISFFYWVGSKGPLKHIKWVVHNLRLFIRPQQCPKILRCRIWGGFQDNTDCSLGGCCGEEKPVKEILYLLCTLECLIHLSQKTFECYLWWSSGNIQMLPFYCRKQKQMSHIGKVHTQNKNLLICRENWGRWILNPKIVISIADPLPLAINFMAQNVPRVVEVGGRAVCPSPVDAAAVWDPISPFTLRNQAPNAMWVEEGGF